MNLAQRIRIGIYLVSQAQRAWGSDRFWDVIGWWHGEVHYTIPRIKEEKRVALEMERAFIDTSEWVFGSNTLQIGSPYEYVHSNIITEGASLSLCVPDQVGYWDWNGIRLGANSRPVPLRQALVNVLFGAKWVDTGTKKNRAEPGPEYKRLAEFLTPHP